MACENLWPNWIIWTRTRATETSWDLKHKLINGLWNVSLPCTSIWQSVHAVYATELIVMTTHSTKTNTQLIISIYTKNLTTHTKNKETKLTLHAESDHMQYKINTASFSRNEYRAVIRQTLDNLVWQQNPDSKVRGANMGPIWGRQDPGGPHVGPMNFAIWEGKPMYVSHFQMIFHLKKFKSRVTHSLFDISMEITQFWFVKIVNKISVLTWIMAWYWIDARYYLSKWLPILRHLSGQNALTDPKSKYNKSDKAMSKMCLWKNTTLQQISIVSG